MNSTNQHVESNVDSINTPRDLEVHLFTSRDKQHRLPITKSALYEFANIKLHNKDKVEMYLHHSEQDAQLWEEVALRLVENGIPTTTVSMISDEYIHKMNVVRKSAAKYICKWDNDVYINRHIWDFMIENMSVVGNDDICMLAPTLSNGVPSADLFLRDFFNEEELTIAYDTFRQSNIPPNVWGGNYHTLYDYITNTTSWDDGEYWRLVDSIDPAQGRNLPWYFPIFKGIHPARFSYEFNMLLANHAINNMEKVKEDSGCYLDRYNTPYLCNNLVITTPEFYSAAQDLFFDHYDEAQLNMLAKQRKQYPLYVRNSYGIQPAYGCTTEAEKIEKYYVEMLFEKLNKL